MSEADAPNGPYRLRRIETDIEMNRKDLDGHEIRLRSLENHDGVMTTELHNLGEQVKANSTEVRGLRKTLIVATVSFAGSAFLFAFTIFAGLH